MPLGPEGQNRPLKVRSTGEAGQSLAALWTADLLQLLPVPVCKY